MMHSRNEKWDSCSPTTASWDDARLLGSSLGKKGLHGHEGLGIYRDVSKEVMSRQKIVIDKDQHIEVYRYLNEGSTAVSSSHPMGKGVVA